MSEGLKVRAWRNPGTDEVLFVIQKRYDNGDRMRLVPKGKGQWAWEPVKEGSELYEQAIGLPEDTPQLLVDALFGLGYRPKEYVPTEAELGLMRDHLNDMRAIVAKMTGAGLPANKA